MSKQRGLGRGLGAFFPSATVRGDPSEREAQRVAMISIDAIDANPHQPRRAFNAQQLESLAQSIRANGMLSPVLVRAAKKAGRYELVAGERRWRAARMAGLAEIPALVRDARDDQSLELALLENLQRADLNPIEEANGLRQLIEEHGFTQETLSHRLGKARPTLANALRLLSLPDSVQAYVRDGQLSAGHARALAALPHDRALRIARAAVTRGLSVRDIERLAGAASPAKSKLKDKKARELSPELAELESKMRFALAARVAIRPGRGGGTIEIRYAGDEELQRIVDTICPEDVQ